MTQPSGNPRVEGGEVRSHAIETRSGQIEAVNIEVTVLIGRTMMPVGKLLQMGRGAVVALDASVDEEVWILANGHPIARGRISLEGENIQIIITGAADVAEFNATSGR